MHTKYFDNLYIYENLNVLAFIIAISYVLYDCLRDLNNVVKEVNDLYITLCTL